MLFNYRFILNYMYPSLKSIKFSFLLTLAFFFQSSRLDAQISEGYFLYIVKATAVDTSLETKQKIGMLQNNSMELSFSGQKARIDFVMGSAMTSTIIVDNTIPKGLSLNKGPQGAFAAYLGARELQKNFMPSDSTARIELINESKVILGFNCKKAILYQNGDVTVYWYTNEIEIDKSNHQVINSMIPGFPLNFYTVKEGIRIEYIISNYSLEVDESKEFSLAVPEGYKLVASGY